MKENKKLRNRCVEGIFVGLGIGLGISLVGHLYSIITIFLNGVF